MFGFFKTDPLKKAKTRYQNKLAEAMNAQRSGNIQEYARLSVEAEEIFKEIEELESENQKD